MPPFRFLLALETGESADPAVFVVAVPEWHVGDTFFASNGQLFRMMFEVCGDRTGRVWQYHPTVDRLETSGERYRAKATDDGSLACLHGSTSSSVSDTHSTSPAFRRSLRPTRFAN